ncbi:MAG: hypothetical protein MJ098_06815 [Saccharofermentans sp.]|nr:hypothetical protein [Saccharofermentans sp.]
MKSIASKTLALGLTLAFLATGCSKAPTELTDDAAKNSLGISNVTSIAHNQSPVSDSEYGSNYTAQDKVSVTYSVDLADGLLNQTVTKEACFYFDRTSGIWDLKEETLVSCEVDTTDLPGSSWISEGLNAELLTGLFGDAAKDSNGTLYIRFLKKMGMFSFNLANDKNTSSERFFETIGTNVKIALVTDSGITEGKAQVRGGSVTDSGELFLDLENDYGRVNLCFGKDAVAISEREYDEATGKEVSASKVYMDSMPVFELTTTSIEDGEWKRECGRQEGNLSPSLTWKPVEGATRYVIVMIDITTTRWLYWYMITDKTELSEGEFTDPEVYTGPYPAGTHTYEIHVIALKDEPQDVSFKVDARGGDIQSYVDFVNTAKDGSTGNVISYGTIKAPYTSPELYYGYR